MGILNSLAELLNGPPAPPPARPLSTPAAPTPKVPASLLDSLLAPAPAPPPADLAALLWAKPGVDIKGAALARMAAAGQLTPSANPIELLVPKLPSTVGLFHKINKAGPKSRKKEEPQIISAMDAPDGGIRADELLAKLGISAEDYSPKSRFAEARRRAGVQHSPEFDRITALPRRPMNLDGFPDLTMEFRKPGGTMELWKVQSAMLAEARIADGLFAAVGVGWGKSLASLLLPVAMRSKKCVLLVPPQLRRKTLYIDIPALYKHWNIPTNLIRVIAYSELSNVKCSKILEELQPDLIVADECHNLRHKTAARTKRFLRYMKEHPECRFAGMSGTITRDSIIDYQHLIELALRKNSPLPAHYGVLVEWAEALDVSDDPASPGALAELCTAEERFDIAGKTVIEAQPIIRAGFRRRLTETQGVIATEEGAIGTSLIINGLHPLVPAEVKVALDELRKKWEIDGEELIDAMSVSRVGRELANGFFYRWAWPGGIKDVEWLGARASWNKELRAILKLNRKGLDSPLEVINAIHAGKIHSDTWDVWAAVSGRPKPPTEAVWLSDYLVDAAIHWARTTCTKSSPGIIWYLWDDYGRRLALKGGFPFYGPGMKNDPSFADPNKEPVIVCSLASHGTGKNLQKYCRNLYTTPPSGGVDWEQSLARTHRPGQEADEVSAEVFLHTQEMAKAFEGAIEDARYIEQTTPNKQKLLYAELLDIEGECY